VRLDFDAAGLHCILDVPLDEQDRFTSFHQAKVPFSGTRPSANGR